MSESDLYSITGLITQVYTLGGGRWLKFIATVHVYYNILANSYILSYTHLPVVSAGSWEVRI